MNNEERQCPVCGKVFIRTQNAQKHCSAECRRKYYARKEVKYKYKEPHVYECAWCGKFF